MGLFDKIDSANQNDQTKHDPVNEAGAWVSMMVAVANCDNDISDVEIDVMSHIFSYKTIFNGYDMMFYYKPALMYCMSNGSKSLIDSCASYIKEESKECLLCVVFDIISRGGMINDKEKEIFEHLATCLNIPESTS